MNRGHLFRTLALIGSTAIWSVGCVAHAQAGGFAEAEAPVTFTSPPTLVEIDSDVWVVRNHERAVYYVSGFYWVYRDGTWWRAQSYDDGWSRTDASTVPPAIATRDHQAYVNYSGATTARTRPAPRAHLASDPGHDRGNPPEHAAAQHGGPPGQNDVPGLGNQRKAEEGNQHADKGDEKKPEKKDEKKDVKKGGPKK